MDNMEVRVIAYSGYKLNERPIYFFMGDSKFMVQKIVDRWRDRDNDFFKIIADDNVTYILKWNREEDKWFLEKARTGPS